MRYYLHLLEWLLSRKELMREWMWWICGIGKDGEKRNYIPEMNINWCRHFRKQYGVLQKIKSKSIVCHSNHVCLCAGQLKSVCWDICTPVFNVVFTMAKDKKRSVSVSLGEDKENVVNIHSGIWLSLQKEVTFVICVNISGSCCDTKCSEQPEKDNYQVITLLWKTWKLNLGRMVCLQGAEKWVEFTEKYKKFLYYKNCIV